MVVNTDHPIGLLAIPSSAVATKLAALGNRPLLWTLRGAMAEGIITFVVIK
jgi:hypothetical protein